MKVSILDSLFRVAARMAAPGGTRARLTIFLYHRVLAKPDPLLPTEPDAAVFNTQMRVVANLFHVLPLGEAVDGLKRSTLPARAACITFDDGYRDNFEVAAPILRRYGLTGTFFVATDFLDGGRMFNDTVIEAVRRIPTGKVDLSWIGLGEAHISDIASRTALMAAFINAIKYMPTDARADASERLGAMAESALSTELMMRSEQVLDLKRMGMDIGGHTLGHPILAQVSPDEARRQIVANRERLTDLLGAAPRHFAYPNGRPGQDYCGEHVAMVRDAGYSAAVSTAPGVATPQDDCFQLPRFSPWHHEENRLRASLLRNAAFGTGAPRVADTSDDPRQNSLAANL
jgi:peptidoglycan/xylan/chitin deacetylase (PgdA/CDA1 family)